MELGVFSKVFQRHPFKTAINKIQSYGFENIQFNFVNLGMSSLPKAITLEQINHVQKTLYNYDISLPVVSGTFNVLERDRIKLRENLEKFNYLLKISKQMGAKYVSVSTGSFNQKSMWSYHPDNQTDKAWYKLQESLKPMLESASKHDIILAFEPEQANVISDAYMAKELIDSFRSPNLKVLYDAANFVNYRNSNYMKETIKDSLNILKKDIVLAHCKDIYATPNKVEFKPIGKGNLPFKFYLDLLSEFYTGPLIMHGIEETDVPYSFNYISNLGIQNIHN